MRLLLTGLLAAAAFAQPAPAPRFEAATIKPAGDLVAVQPQRTPGRIRWTAQILSLIAFAYDVPVNRITAPRPLPQAYSLEAVFDAAAPEPQVRLMLRSLLADRFKMKAREVTAEQSGFGLYIEKAQLKIQPAEPVTPRTLPDGTPDPATRSYIYSRLPEKNVAEMNATRVTMAQLADRIASEERKPVWDRTGLTGVYTFSFRFSTSPSVEQTFADPPLAAALKQNLGLELRPENGPVRQLIIDQIQEPTEN